MQMLAGTVYRNLHEQSTYGTEAYRQMLLDEAYYGKQKIKPVQDAMDAIAKHCWKDPKWRVQDSKEAADLEKAFCKVFGFKHCSIYWRYTNPTAINVPLGMIGKDGFMGGGYTTPSFVLIPDTSAKSPDKYGTAKTGFYDSSHTMNVAVGLDQAYFSPTLGLGMSSEEVVAVILHEIGHNFDNTTFRLMQSWYYLADHIIDLARVAKENDYEFIPTARAAVDIVGSDVADVIISKVAPEYYNLILNMDDVLVTMFPPFATVYRAFSNFVAGIFAIANTLALPYYLLRLITKIPKKLLSVPISKGVDLFTHWFFTNKMETYADSFAAQYGYGVELNTGVKKLYKGNVGEFEVLKNTPVDVVMRPFWDIYYLMIDVASAVDGHGDSNERWKRTMATLDQDLAASGLSAADKKLILAEKARIQKEYDKFMKMDAERKMFATAVYRKAMDCWYHGNSHGFIKTIFADKTYAQ